MNLTIISVTYKNGVLEYNAIERKDKALAVVQIYGNDFLYIKAINVINRDAVLDIFKRCTKYFIPIYKLSVYYYDYTDVVTITAILKDDNNEVWGYEIVDQELNVTKISNNDLLKSNFRFTNAINNGNSIILTNEIKRLHKDCDEPIILETGYSITDNNYIYTFNGTRISGRGYDGIPNYKNTEISTDSFELGWCVGIISFKDYNPNILFKRELHGFKVIDNSWMFEFAEIPYVKPILYDIATNKSRDLFMDSVITTIDFTEVDVGQLRHNIIDGMSLSIGSPNKHRLFGCTKYIIINKSHETGLSDSKVYMEGEYLLNSLKKYRDVFYISKNNIQKTIAKLQMIGNESALLIVKDK